MTPLPTVSLLALSPRASIPADAAVSGQLIPPIDRIKILSAQQWEEFVLEWADSLRERYTRVERCGGAGDMGRDIVAISSDGGAVWDNYQCKHYRSPLSPHDVWLELGKLLYYTHRGDYAYPRRYFFIAPQGAGTKLSNLMKKPDELRAQLAAHWDSHCRTKITSAEAVELNTERRTYLAEMDFSIFEAIPPLRIIDEHAKTRWYVARFGGGLPPRPPVDLPPADPMAHELTYVSRLMEAYGDHLQREVRSVTDLGEEANLRDHFGDARLEFYSAESLRAFSRDTLPPGEYDKLQDEIHTGIKDDIRAEYADGYQRVIAVVRTARILQLAGHALHGRLAVRDRGGICHQLANDEKVKWIK